MKGKVLKALKDSVDRQFRELGACEIIKGDILINDKELLLKQLFEKLDLINNKSKK